MDQLPEAYAVALIAAASALVGGLIAHRLQLGTKRREERNAAAARLRVKLQKISDNSERDWDTDLGDDLHVLERTSTWSARRRLARLVEAYREGTKTMARPTAFGSQRFFVDHKKASDAASALAAFCRHE